MIKPEIAPDWLLSRARRRPLTAPAALGQVGKIPTGQRHSVLLRLAGAMRRVGADPDTIYTALRQLSETTFEVPEADTEIRRVANSLERYEPVAERRIYSGEADRADAPPIDESAPFGFCGDRLRATRDEDTPRSPIEGMIDPEPHLHLLIARPKVGKSRLALWVAQRWASGLPVWEGMAPIPQGPVLLVSVEQTVRIIDRILVDYQTDEDASWEDQLAIVSRHRTATTRERQAFRLDSEGLGVLVEEMSTAREEGRPYKLVVIDSLSRIKPADCDENSNDDMTAWLQALETIADTQASHLLLIHHEGHAQRDGAVSSTRGASAITAVPQVVWHLDRIKDAPTYRRLTISGNNVTGQTIELEVADAHIHKHDAIHYWRQVTVAAEYPCAGSLLVEGQVYNLTALARLLAGRDNELPATSVERAHAGDVVHHWTRTCQVYESEQRGPRNARLFRLRLDVIGVDGLPVG